jgi:hypothetical protein
MKEKLIFMITMKRREQGWTDEAINKMRKKLFRTKISDLKALNAAIKWPEHWKHQ